MSSVDTKITLMYSLFYMIRIRRLIVWSFAIISLKKALILSIYSKIGSNLRQQPVLLKNRKNIKLTIRITQQMMQLGVP